MFKRLFVVACFLFLGIFFWWRVATSPADQKATTAQVFTIPKGQAIDTIGSRLKQAGLIRSRLAFKIFVLTHNLSQKIQAGSFRLKPSLTLPDLSRQLTSGTLDIWVTLLEGWRREEIASKLTQEFVASGSDFDQSEFLRLTSSREGYLFPDTYLLPREASASAVVKILTDTFTKKVDLTQNQSGLTDREVVILASLIEREVRTDTDRSLVAGILVKRLRAGWPLQVDATVQYVVGDSPNWWPQNLTKTDIAVNSPYNTYKYPGLPPTPIANPGLASLTAAMNPQNSPYWFYLSDPQGKLHYAQTIEDHNLNISRYLTN